MLGIIKLYYLPLSLSYFHPIAWVHIRFCLHEILLNICDRAQVVLLCKVYAVQSVFSPYFYRILLKEFFSHYKNTLKYNVPTIYAKYAYRWHYACYVQHIPFVVCCILFPILKLKENIFNISGKKMFQTLCPAAVPLVCKKNIFYTWLDNIYWITNFYVFHNAIPMLKSEHIASA